MIFFFNDTATTEIYTLSLHDALPIYVRPPARDERGDEAEAGRVVVRGGRRERQARLRVDDPRRLPAAEGLADEALRSEEHTSELQSRQYLVCRLLLEKKNYNMIYE